jgi:RNA polymerase sigma-70 factor (ECF subfamily)
MATQKSATGQARGQPSLEQSIVDARGGSADAAGKVFAACRDYLLVVAAKELSPDVRPKVGASDLVQETLLRAAREFGHFDGVNKQDLLAWLRRMLLRRLTVVERKYRNTTKRELAREVPLAGLSSSIGPGAGDIGKPDTPSKLAIAREERETIEQTLATLPEDYRRAIDLRCWEHCSFAEIGRRLGRSEEAAQKLWYRAIRRLKHECRQGG